MLRYICNPSNWEMEERGSEIQGHSHQQSGSFQTSLGYIKLCLRKSN